MKFKKIEISAFRIYDNPKDATFDFSLSDNGVADFVSIYAPNGFGKTSFYDAVEWCMTNNIQRFWQNKEITEGAINAQNNFHDGQLKIYQNIDSKLETFVNILDENDTSIQRILNTRAKSDAKYVKEPERRNFSTVILSQEWVSAFLKETNGVERYKIFMSNPELQNLAEYFKNLKVLVGQCNKNISSFEYNVANRERDILNDQNSNLLDSISSTISVLESMGQVVAHPSLDMDELQVLEFKNSITNAKSQIKTGSLVQQIADLQIAKAGSDGIAGVDQYYDLITTRSHLNKELENLHFLVEQYKKLDTFQIERESFDEHRRKTLISKEELLTLRSIFPEYKQVEILLSTKQSSLRDLELERSRLQSIHSNQKQIFNDEKGKIDILSKRVEAINATILDVPNIELDINISFEHLAFFYFGVEQIDAQIFAISLVNVQLLNEVQEYKEILETFIKNGEFERINRSLIGQSDSHRLDVLIELKKNHHDITQALEIVDQRIVEFESMNSLLKEVLSKGLDLINENKLSDCPLCSQTYNSYSTLLEKVTTNKLIEETISNLWSEQALLKQKLENNSKVIAENIQFINSYIGQRSTVLSSFIESNSNQISNLELDQRVINSLINETITIIINNRLKLDNKTPDAFVAYLTTSLIELSQTVNDSKKMRDDIYKELGVTEIELGINQNKISRIEKEVEDLKGNNSYKSISNWFFFEEPQKEISEQILIDRIVVIESSFINYDNKLKTTEDSIKILNLQLESISRENTIKTQNQSEEQLLLTNNIIKRYIEFLNSSLDILNIPEIKQDLITILDTKIHERQEELARAKLINDQFLKLETYTENLMPFLRIAKLKEQNRVDNAEIKVINKMKAELEDEWRKVKEELDGKLKQFFYLDLINTIYNKIDPHPTLKKVDFHVDLDAEDPKLDIFVKDDSIDVEKPYVPNLYFSTAQINILSLSIFLASALNSKEYKCIFIDDPIQSLDTINILSTIDLLRSIVINHGRQIILSTHDENFHKLLARKIPSDFFKSKFIELESFGKVKKSFEDISQ
ncbi:exonuclease SbcC [Chitinophaga sp. YR627]|uniref:AAA family ATPase n=1 Tax=Chitinophaga sp. YR627 TaxID=1881041 RepID=UPI0008EAFEFC|nr:AAA family ATPase [Chitinophaga sp. YR627]SFO75673.1 exonuclease SbcC [Chitinophaga sp. YR627]